MTDEEQETFDILGCDPEHREDKCQFCHAVVTGLDIINQAGRENRIGMVKGVV